MDAREFFGLEIDGGTAGSELRGRLVVRPELCTPAGVLFGGCGLGAGLVALEAATGRPTIWASAQYLSFATVGQIVDYEVVLASRGRHITQGRVVARTEAGEILTVNAALGVPQGDLQGTWVAPPTVPAPEDCPTRKLPPQFVNSILDSITVRVAKGRSPNQLDGTPGSPDSALWVQVPGDLNPSAATLAIFGDLVSGGPAEPLGRRTMGRSLDNTLRVVRPVPTGWVLCDIRMQAIYNDYAQGTAYLWSEDGALLATASQSLSVRFRPPDTLPDGAPSK